MKKSLASILCGILVLGLGTSALAADPTPEAKDVIVSTKNADQVSAVYKHTITWDSLTFTYDFGATTNTWDAENHEYTITDSVSGWDKTTADISVQNDSNKGIGVILEVDVTTKNNVSASLSKTSFELATAEGTAKGDGPKDTATLTISGIPNTTTQFNHSKVTVTITH